MDTMTDDTIIPVAQDNHDQGNHDQGNHIPEDTYGRVCVNYANLKAIPIDVSSVMDDIKAHISDEVSPRDASIDNCYKYMYKFLASMFIVGLLCLCIWVFYIFSYGANIINIDNARYFGTILSVVLWILNICICIIMLILLITLFRVSGMAMCLYLILRSCNLCNRLTRQLEIFLSL